MTKPFKPGDRVKVYHRFPFHGKVDSIHPNGLVRVIEDGFYSVHEESPFHPKQLRRLKPRTPKPAEKGPPIVDSKPSTINHPLRVECRVEWKELRIDEVHLVYPSFPSGMFSPDLVGKRGRLVFIEEEGE